MADTADPSAILDAMSERDRLVAIGYPRELQDVPRLIAAVRAALRLADGGKATPVMIRAVIGHELTGVPVEDFLSADCPACGRTVRLRGDGTLEMHAVLPKRGSRNCPGAHRDPGAITRELTGGG